MINIGICDDEASMRKSLRAPLEQELQLLGLTYQFFEYDSGESLVGRQETQWLDILFLDIEMKDLNGMDTARILRCQNVRTLLIFVTAYPDFVFQGYEVHAFHYILKPYDVPKIKSVLAQALKELDKNEEPFFSLEQKSGTYKVPVQRIAAFSSDKRKVVISLEDGSSLEFYGKLDTVAGSLPGYFIRCHNRHLINLNFITALEKDRCICGIYTFPVSRAYRQPLEIAFARLLLR